MVKMIDRFILKRRGHTFYSWPLLLFSCVGAVLVSRFYAAAGDMEVLPDSDVMHAIHIDAFQFLAWAAVVYLLKQSMPGRCTSIPTIAGALCVTVIALFNSAAGVAALSVFLLISSGGEARMIAVATIVAALFTQQAIVPIVYALLEAKLIHFDAMLVGTAVELTVKGATWQDNIIAVPSGHSIEVMSGCCSFRNVSLAVLSWVALTKLERPQWHPMDVAVLSLAAGCQIVLNVVRIYLMALSPEMYMYWHVGTGQRIFAITASAAAVLISAFGARYVSDAYADARICAEPALVKVAR